ncbi:hypothetical protein P4V41_20605 [Fictibacillus nanhaiensis]|uniref:hypothetical protein n=1 Tax=Fictibacillus nanhaiensis TaxID=742169 RepID=UPI002E1C084A|nr:hypothetical protein [Fictibacillus nanhaiensis]
MDKMIQVLERTERGLRVRRVSEHDMKRDLQHFDDAFIDGVFTEGKLKKPRTKLRPMLAYCKERGITPDELTSEEWKQFYE